MPFITYLSGLLTAQMLSDDQLISGVEIRCEEKGRCPSTCHLCRRPGKEQLSPTPVLLEISRVVPLYTLIQDNGTKEVSSPVRLLGHIWVPALPPLALRALCHQDGHPQRGEGQHVLTAYMW